MHIENHLSIKSDNDASSAMHEASLRDICAYVSEAVKGSPEDLMKIADMLTKEALDDVAQAIEQASQAYSGH